MATVERFSHNSPDELREVLAANAQLLMLGRKKPKKKKK